MSGVALTLNEWIFSLGILRDLFLLLDIKIPPVTLSSFNQLWVVLQPSWKSCELNTQDNFKKSVGGSGFHEPQGGKEVICPDSSSPGTHAGVHFLLEALLNPDPSVGFSEQSADCSRKEFPKVPPCSNFPSTYTF